MTLKSTRVAFLAISFAFVLSACGSPGPSSGQVASAIQSRIAALDRGAASVRGQRLWMRKAVTDFYQDRKAERAWDGGDTDGILKAIREIDRDGLNPADYHLAAIEKLEKEREKATSPALEADLDLLLTDAVAAMVDHTRYGRVRPVSLNPSWNVDPREGAPRLDREVAQIAQASSAGDAVESAKPIHFIYQGLKRALAQLREIAAGGGWSAVPQGKPIRPGGVDRRIPAIRARLKATGEYGGGQSASTTYDPELKKAVELFQARNRLDGNGIIDKDVINAMNVTVAARIGQVRSNMERARWVLPGLGDEFLLVNLPAYKAYLIRGDKNIWEARTQIGEEGKETPSFRATMQTVVFNPDWTVPASIVKEEIAPGMNQGKNYLAQKGLVVTDQSGNEVDPGSVDWGNAENGDFPYTLKQPPGPANALGRVKFLFPNPYSIYLHDTPSKGSFESEKRTFSHGCIRLENPLELAEILLTGQDGWNAAKIQEALATEKTTNVELEKRLPVVIVYWTVTVGASGEIRYARDIYGLDPRVLAALDGRRM